MEYKALQVCEAESGYSASVEILNTENLPDGDVLIKVSFSSLNFKDALSYSGNKGVTRNYPHTPGIDAVGEVASCDGASFEVGQKVLVIGYDLGMNTSGGFGEFIRVPAQWVMPLPKGLTEKQAMAWGTAGFTAALCVEKLLSQGIEKESGPVLVTGATGGVGSIAIQLLNKLGFEAHALTGKPEAHGFLKSVGAAEVVDRNEFDVNNKRPMLKPVYAAAVDALGGDVLATILKQIQYGGAVACCGLAASPALNTTVLPFILRGVDLLGVDSVELPLEKKTSVWQKIAAQWSLDNLENVCELISKQQLSEKLELILNGKVQGRYILDHSL